MFKNLLNKASKGNSILTICLSPSRSLSTNVSPSRAVFYVPASDQKKVSKIFETKADCVVLDIEDGVALNRKQQARENIRNLFMNRKEVQTNTDGKYTVRINAPLTELAKDDIKALFTNLPKESLPKCVFVPKTNTPDEIKWLYEQLNNAIKSNESSIDNLNLFFYMESATSLINLKEIIQTALNLTSTQYNNRFNLEGFVFGSDDFCADVGATRTYDASELIYARQKMVTYCKAFKLKAIDMVYIDFKDLNGLKLQSEQGYRMGFTGKQVIHPAQVDTVQEAFKPSEDKIKWATGLVEAFEQHQRSGAGAFNYMGQMIDMPSLLQAKNVLTIVEKINKNK